MLEYYQYQQTNAAIQQAVEQVENENPTIFICAVSLIAFMFLAWIVIAEILVNRENRR